MSFCICWWYLVSLGCDITLCLLAGVLKYFNFSLRVLLVLKFASNWNSCSTFFGRMRGWNSWFLFWNWSGEIHYWKSAKSAPALCSPPSQPHQFFQFFRRRVAQHQLLSSGGCKFKKEKTSSNGCFMYWECCSAFLLYTRPKKCRCPLNPLDSYFPLHN